MKLDKVQFRERVCLPGQTVHALDMQVSGEAYSLELEAGIVTIRKDGCDEETLVPIGNVAFAKRRLKPVAPVKKVA